MNVDDVSDSENEDNIEEEIQLAVSPRFNWKDVDGVAKPNATIRQVNRHNKNILIFSYFDFNFFLDVLIEILLNVF